MQRVTLWRLAAAVLGVTLAGCATERVSAPADHASGTLVASAAGVQVPEAVMRARLDRITRLLARALKDSARRMAVFNALHASPYPEHKLHFRTFLDGAGRGALAKMAALQGGGATGRDLMAAVDSIEDLEFYMPVEQHFTEWTGDAQLLVASALHDHEVPHAYDLDGHAVQLGSASVAPTTPTLAVVPVETDFSLRPSFQQCLPDVCGYGGGGGDGGGGGGSGGRFLPPSLAPGVRMTFSDIPGSYEGFLMGNPEFEIHAIGRTSGNDVAMRDLQCAGEHAQTADAQPGVKSSDYVYDQNDERWTGNVLLFSKTQAQNAQVLDTSVVYWVWEDDNTACKIVKDSVEVQALIRGTKALLENGKNAIQMLLNPTSLVPKSLVRAMAGVFAAFQNDDVVGFLVAASEVDATWSDANYAIVLKNPATGKLEVRGRVKLVAQD